MGPVAGTPIVNALGLVSKTIDLKDQVESATDRFKQTATRALVARDLAGAMVGGSVLLILGGIAYGLSVFIHPALAAVVTGAGTLVTLLIGLTLATRPRKTPPSED